MKPFILIISLTCAILLSPVSQAVIILDSTHEKFGFEKAEALARLPQFKSLMYVDKEASGSWIGNYKGHSYVLSAAHFYKADAKPSDYTYRTLDGKVYHADKLFFHPLWNDNFDERTGYDFVIVQLTEEVHDAGPQPALYGGSSEKGKTLTFLGYGYRGVGHKGQDTTIETNDMPAGGVGLIEKVKDAIEPVPSGGDAGSYFGIWLPKEDGSIPNPINKNGITRPISPLTGILGSGDSGGPAWIETDTGWAIAGISSNGNGHAKYGDACWFARVSHVKSWIKSIVPVAHFVE